MSTVRQVEFEDVVKCQRRTSQTVDNRCVLILPFVGIVRTGKLQYLKSHSKSQNVTHHTTSHEGISQEHSPISSARDSMSSFTREQWKRTRYVQRTCCCTTTRNSQLKGFNVLLVGLNRMSNSHQNRSLIYFSYNGLS